MRLCHRSLLLVAAFICLLRWNVVATEWRDWRRQHEVR